MSKECSLDEKFLFEAFKQAKKAYDAGEVPVGAVLVRNKQVVAKGHNQVELLKDATAHAEMICVTAGANAIGNWRLQECTLYCTLEPCVMCAGAMLLSRVDRLVYGAKDIRHGAAGSFVDIFSEKHPTHSIEIRGGVLEEPCGLLMKEFFREKRGDKESRRA